MKNVLKAFDIFLLQTHLVSGVSGAGWPPARPAVAGEQGAGGDLAVLEGGDPLSDPGRRGAEPDVGPAGHGAGRDHARRRRSPAGSRRTARRRTGPSCGAARSHSVSGRSPRVATTTSAPTSLPSSRVSVQPRRPRSTPRTRRPRRSSTPVVADLLGHVLGGADRRWPGSSRPGWSR